MCFERKQIGNRLTEEEEERRSGNPEEDDSRTILGRHVGNGIQATGGPTGLYSLPQVPAVCWERFLPIRSLKVLLVENDDSTRHVVSALLRNCSYEVNGAANGLQAWKILEDPNNRTDIILTEVVMPVLSGIALLCKIMSHKSLKNIPVIMMSSHDSMGLVFKCLSKGAVDFLVKPIRKNELKNLWQHVWRRCHSSSGSGSESGTESRKYIKPKSNGESDNNSSSSREQDNGSTCLSIQDGSEHRSGTQSSRAAGDHSPLSLSPGDLLADTPDSTCAQVIHTKHEKYSNGWAHSTEAKECTKEDDKFDDIAIEKKLEVGVTRKTDSQCEYPLKKSTVALPGKRKNKLYEVDGNQGLLDQNGEKNCGANVNCNKPLSEGRVVATSNVISDVSHVNGNCESGDFPSLEFSLKRLRGAGDVRNAALDDCNVLRHSGPSAFSKYNTPSANQVTPIVAQTIEAPTGNAGSCSPFGSSLVAPNTRPPHNFPSNSNSTPPNQRSNESSNNNDMASTNKYDPPKPESFSEKPDLTSTFKSSHTSAFQPVQNGCVCVAATGKTDAGEEADPDQAPGRHGYQKVQVQHHHHHHHHYHHHVRNMQQEDDHDDISLKNMAATAQQCGSSNAFGGIVDAQAGNYSMNGSASGSNLGSNGQNGNSAALNAATVNVESENGVAGNSGGGGISQRNEVDECRVSQREAALTKFRLKRKERCFEKRVRYHSRKKLAEQRPRIRGQFVRQIVSDSKAGDDYLSEDFKSEDNSGNSVQ